MLFSLSFGVSIGKYQEQESAGLRKKHQLEQSLVQLELDAQQHQQKWQSKQLDHQQQLVEQFTSTRDHVSNTTSNMLYFIVSCM